MLDICKNCDFFGSGDPSRGNGAFLKKEAEKKGKR
jgi:hypothetical protein